MVVDGYEQRRGRWARIQEGVKRRAQQVADSR
jgi:hypothetical protein